MTSFKHSGVEFTGNRAVTLQFLEDFTWEFDCWHTPTVEVVKNIIIPATKELSMPYTSLIDPSLVGSATIFLSHAWSNDFGLLVAAARKYVSDLKHQPFQQRAHRKRKNFSVSLDRHFCHHPASRACSSSRPCRSRAHHRPPRMHDLGRYR